MAYWLMKSEPNEYNIDDLKEEDVTYWDGIRNYQSRNFMRTMEIGDEAFFYHSSCKVPGISGIMRIVKKTYPDHTAFDPEDHHYDPKTHADNPRWDMVDVKYVKTFSEMITLKMLKAEPALSEMLVLRRGNRLSITPVTKDEWEYILTLEP